VSHFAAAVTRTAKIWAASELDLNGAADIDEILDRLRDVEPEAEIALLFVESDDSYLAVLRLDDGEDLRIFGSDAVFAEENRLGALLLGDVGAEPAAELDDDSSDSEENSEENSPPADVEPIGDADLLTDLGMPAHRLRELCGQEGMLPADITAEVCQAIGCGDEIEELREA
jgi:putative tRNA adenosine deaminase-associated protein